MKPPLRQSFIVLLFCRSMANHTGGLRPREMTLRIGICIFFIFYPLYNHLFTILMYAKNFANIYLDTMLYPRFLENFFFTIMTVTKQVFISRFLSLNILISILISIFCWILHRFVLQEHTIMYFHFRSSYIEIIFIRTYYVFLTSMRWE